MRMKSTNPIEPARVPLSLIVFGALSTTVVLGDEPAMTRLIDAASVIAEKAEYQSAGKLSEKSRRVIDSAVTRLQENPVTVMQKTQTAASGDKHDYLSLAPYWWPDKSKPDGLPYVRRDGRVNPSSQGDHVDFGTKEKMFSRVSSLSKAAFLTDNSEYAQAAVEQLNAWFVDPATRMNPNLDYAQGVPGINDGRPVGMIEWCGFDKVLVSIEWLRLIDAMPESTDEAMNQWLTDYVRWMQTSEIGMRERAHLNNHGTWYDVQLSSILVFLGRDQEARELLESVKTKRIAVQIEPDGRQPHELARTKSLSYSKMNLRAFERLARLGKKLGVDLAGYETSDGRSISKAREFLKPYLDGSKEWPYQQL